MESSDGNDESSDQPDEESLKVTQIERISIDLDNGFLIVNLPDLPDLDLKSNHIVNDGIWHDVILEFFPTSKVMLLIDKVSHYYVIQSSRNYFLPSNYVTNYTLRNSIVT